MPITESDRRPAQDGFAEFKNSKYNRDEATDMAYNTAKRPALSIRANPEEFDLQPHPIGNFSKGLPHTLEGNVAPQAYEMFVRSLRQSNDLSKSGGFPAPLGPDPVHHPAGYNMSADVITDAFGNPGPAPITHYHFKNASSPDPVATRKWESPLGGLNSDITGPCIGGVSLPPAPALGSSELCAEMAEVYAMALTRDIAFADLQNINCVVHSGAEGEVTIGDIVSELGALPWFDPNGMPISSERTDNGTFAQTLTNQETRRRAARWDEHGEFSVKSLFRGSTEGAKKGAYLSQFMLQGGGDDRAAGQIPFGTQTIDQRTQPDNAHLDYMVTWMEWLDVQNGARFTGVDRTEAPRFLTTPRDLAAYVHMDQLYQAYFNAALLLLGSKRAEGVSAFDHGLPNNSMEPDATREGFATWGGPHLLDLLASVSSRGLKIIRRQKFQIHRRARPEVLAARLALANNGQLDALGAGGTRVQSMLHELWQRCPKLMGAIAERNSSAPGPDARGLTIEAELPETPIDGGANLLLPMAFPEGSPMHPAYGAGHATVAGACVTVLKALLNTVNKDGQKVTMQDFGFDASYQSVKSKFGDYCLQDTGDHHLTVTDELDKLAANISIGRNMAGVHYYTDYFESLRLGERVAIGILQEHLQTSPEDISLHLIDFDGRSVQIKKTGGANYGAEAEIIVNDGAISTADWWTENVAEYEIEPPIIQRLVG